MSKHHVQISSSVSDLVSFIKERISTNIIESSQGGSLSDLERSDIEKIITIVDSSASQAFSLGYSNVESTVTKVLEESKRN